MIFCVAKLFFMVKWTKHHHTTLCGRCSKVNLRYVAKCHAPKKYSRNILFKKIAGLEYGGGVWGGFKENINFIVKI